MVAVLCHSTLLASWSALAVVARLPSAYLVTLGIKIIGGTVLSTFILRTADWTELAATDPAAHVVSLLPAETKWRRVMFAEVNVSPGGGSCNKE